MPATHCIAFNKPFGVLCQFSAADGRKTLADWIDVPNVYPAGRLDADSEGLVLLTNDGKLQARITQPGSRRQGKLWKRYWVQVEGEPDETALKKLQSGVQLKDGLSRPARAKLIDEPNPLWPRNPPIRERKNIPTRWLEIELNEGRNRQVRRMTAAAGFPTLRLIRAAIGSLTLNSLQPGDFLALSEAQIQALLRQRA